LNVTQLLKLALACVAALALTVGVAACGDDEEAQELSFTITEGKLSGPSSAETGEAEVTLKNDGEKDGELQLIRVEGDHSAEEVIEALGGAQQGKPFPAWFRAGGGIGVTKPGEEKSATQLMMPGTYYAFDLEAGEPDAGSVPAIEVSGDETDESLDADATVTAQDADDDYRFEADGLGSGESEIVFENAGEQPHHLLISKLKGDGTAEEVETFFKTEKGEPPLEEEGSIDTAVIEGGESQVVDVDLKPGRYVFYCFISDRDGGPPHALKGMVSEIEVE
jgi:Copper binding proteins, plastocyanin/azurin family